MQPSAAGSPQQAPTAADAPDQSPAAARRLLLERAPVVIETRGLNKRFNVPEAGFDTLRERLAHPLSARRVRTLDALRDVSFDVHRGEFFGIVGRNGSGKSTLLKVIASIYRADSGRVRIAGRLAPFIELGVGFNPELTARENVALNGVLMGLGRREARQRLDSVLEFAELREFAQLKLKNYSSGMMVRLAFAVMVEADADVMLIDEVLAVGDAAFAQKCLAFFRERRDAGRTIVLVTHDMTTVQAFCDRAMLMHDAELVYVGEPDEAALRYYRLNFGGEEAAPHAGALAEVNVRVLDSWLEDGTGRRVQNVEQDAQLVFNCLLETRRELRSPVFGFHFMDADGARIFGFNKTLGNADEALAAGRRVLISGPVENRLLPGRYHVNCWISRNRAAGDLALHPLRLLDFIVYGARPGPGSVAVEDGVEVRLLDR